MPLVDDEVVQNEQPDPSLPDQSSTSPNVEAGDETTRPLLGSPPERVGLAQLPYTNICSITTKRGIPC
jgi:hypothetical protein